SPSTACTTPARARRCTGPERLGLSSGQGYHGRCRAATTSPGFTARRSLPGMNGTLRNASLIGMIGKGPRAMAKARAEFAAAEPKLLESQSTLANMRGDKDKEARERGRKRSLSFTRCGKKRSRARGTRQKRANGKRSLRWGRSEGGGATPSV